MYAVSTVLPSTLEKDPTGHGEQSASDDHVAPARDTYRARLYVYVPVSRAYLGSIAAEDEEAVPAEDGRR
jgi:hypothetical protein